MGVVKLLAWLSNTFNTLPHEGLTRCVNHFINEQVQEAVFTDKCLGRLF